MGKAHINSRLIAILPKVLHINNVDIIEAAELSESTWYRIIREPGRITLQQLLALANSLQVPVRRFFSFDDFDYIGTRQDYVVDTGYKECWYDADAVRQRVGPGTDITWAAAAKPIGLNWKRAEPVLLSSSRLPVSSFLSFCDKFKFDPFEFIVDENGIETKPEGKRIRRKPAARPAEKKKQEKQADNKPAEKKRDNTGNREMADVMKEMAELKSCLEELKKEYSALLAAHKKLEHSISVKIDTVNGSHLAIFAEPEAEYGKKKEEEN